MSPIKAKVAAGTPTAGIWVTTNAIPVAESVGKAGLDFVIVDTQHGGVTSADLLPLLIALGADTPAIVRVTWNDPALIMRALDSGAGGVIIPMVSTAADAAAAAAAVRYPPQGIRSFGPLRGFATPAEANQSALCLPMIETVEGVANLAEIVATPGVDGIFVGPMDLALSMGHGLDYRAFHPDVLAAIDQVVELCRRHGKIAGTVSIGDAMTADLLKRGLNFLAIGADRGYIQQGVQRALQYFRQL